MGRNQHVVPHGNKWGVKGAGAKRFTSFHKTQADAIQTAREIAQNQHKELFVHNQYGQIRDRDSFGNDPCPPKDKVH